MARDEEEPWEIVGRHAEYLHVRELPVEQDSIYSLIKIDGPEEALEALAEVLRNKAKPGRSIDITLDDGLLVTVSKPDYHRAIVHEAFTTGEQPEAPPVESYARSPRPVYNRFVLQKAAQKAKEAKATLPGEDDLFDQYAEENDGDIPPHPAVHSICNIIANCRQKTER